MENYDVVSAESAIYRILSLSLCYPEKNFYTYMATSMFQELGAELEKLPYSPALTEDKNALLKVWQDAYGKFTLDNWQLDYTGTFIHSPGIETCYPYECIYRDKSSMLFTDTTQAVKRAYGNFGLVLSFDFKDMPDHIAAELEFMHFLRLNQAESIKVEEEAKENYFNQSQIWFLNEHIDKWATDFLACMGNNHSASLFYPLVNFARNFIVQAKKYHFAVANLADKDSKIEKPVWQLDTSTLRILYNDAKAAEEETKWVYTTSPERYWYSPVKVKVVNGRAEKITPRDDVPFYEGAQDIRSFAAFAKLYGADRLKFPLKRVGERGEGKFKRISWEEALDEISVHMKKYRDEGNAKYVAFLRTHPPLEVMFSHFAHHYGSPNDLHTSTTSCYADGAVAEALTVGSYGPELGNDDYLNTKYVLYIGHSLTNGLRQLPRIARFAEAMRRGTRFVFVDPRLNEGSYAYGSEWVPIKPGTDAALVLALTNIIIRENLYDTDFLLKYTNAPILIDTKRQPLQDESGNYLVWDNTTGKAVPLGKVAKPELLGEYDITYNGVMSKFKTAFQLLAERAAEYPAVKASEITTIPASRIETMARELGTLKPAVAIFSQEEVSAQYSNSLQYCRARNVLMALLGTIDRPGGKYYGPSGDDGIKLNKGADFRIPIKVHEMTSDRVDHDAKIHPLINTSLAAYPIGIAQNFLKAINTGEPYPIKMLFIIGSDVLGSHSREWREAFQKVDFIVKSHIWPDDDIDYADIVLPETAYLEREDGFAKVSVFDPADMSREFSFLTVMQQVVKPQFEQRDWTDFMPELARRIGFGEQYDFTLDEYWDFLLKPAGITINELRKQGVFYPTPLVSRKIEFGKKERWPTKTGLINVFSPELAAAWSQRERDALFDPLPAYKPITVEPKEKDEFFLINGKCSYFKCNFYRNNSVLLEEYLEGEMGNTRLWMNARRAAELDIQNGDWVFIESNSTGHRDRVRVKVTEGIHPSAVWHIYGSGRRAKLMDRYSRGSEGINVEDFIPEHFTPYTAGQAHCEAVVKITKVEAK